MEGASYASSTERECGTGVGTAAGTEKQSITSQQMHRTGQPVANQTAVVAILGVAHFPSLHVRVTQGTEAPAHHDQTPLMYQSPYASQTPLAPAVCSTRLVRPATQLWAEPFAVQSPLLCCLQF